MATDSAQYLADKKADLVELKATISKVRRQQAYGLKDGQGEQSVTRAAYKDLIAERDKLELEILALENPNSDAGFYARPL